MKRWWKYEKEQVLQQLQSNEKQGISNEEALRRLSQYGKNEIGSQNQKTGFWQRFLAQLNDFLVVVLLAAAAVSAAIAFLQREPAWDSLLIIIIVVLNALFGVLQEAKAEASLAALEKMCGPKAQVLRNGQAVTIDSTQVVPGDILLLKAGDAVTADGRLLQADGLQAEESALTGESVPVSKITSAISKEELTAGDRKNMVFRGSFITRGKAAAVVTATGAQTEMGQIASLLQGGTEEQTPLQQRLSTIGKELAIGVTVLCGILFLLGMLRGEDLFVMFMTSVSLAVAAIPEGLPAIVTVVLAAGTQKMSRKNAVVRRLSAVETLGRATVICSDKTGTLTQNRMTVVRKEALSGTLSAEGERMLLSCGVLGCEMGESQQADPTERALLQAATRAGLNAESLRKDMPVVWEIPFSSETKKMAVCRKDGAGGYLWIEKGAPERILPRCHTCLLSKGTVPMTVSLSAAGFRKSGAMAAEGLRIMAVAYAQSEHCFSKEKEAPLTFLGFFALEDPPRSDAKIAVEEAKEAGIETIMITGDHALTAKAIGRELGIFEEGDRCLTGEDVERLTAEELAQACDHVSVFARVTPAHKLKIVKALQQKGHIVAMTGDGVNDAPALQAADIGCAMGKSGTEVAKGAADLVLLDDRFSTILTAVKEGRAIYDNIQKAVHFLLSSNIGEILTLFLAMVLGWEAPLLPKQLLWVNLVTDSLPAIALGLDPPQKNLMQQKPLPAKEGFFGSGLGTRIILEGIMIGLLSLSAFALGLHLAGLNAARTMAFSVLALSQLVHAFNMQSKGSILLLSPMRNPLLCGSFLVGLFLQWAMTMIPSVSMLFGAIALPAPLWGIVLLLSFLPLFIVEAEKGISQWLAKEKTEA